MSCMGNDHSRGIACRGAAIGVRFCMIADRAMISLAGWRHLDDLDLADPDIGHELRVPPDDRPDGLGRDRGS